MRKGFTLTELLLLVLVIAVIIFIGWSVFYGTPTIRLFIGLGLVTLYLPATISGIIHGRLSTIHGLAMMVGVLLIASKFIL